MFDRQPRRKPHGRPILGRSLSRSLQGNAIRGKLLNGGDLISGRRQTVIQGQAPTQGQAPGPQGQAQGSRGSLTDWQTRSRAVVGVEPDQFSVAGVLSDLVAPAARAFWDERLRQMPCVFGRLAFLTSLRDPNCGTYRLPELENRFGEPAVTRALRSTHLQAFWEWLEFSLEEKRADLALYLSMLPDHRRVVLRSWSEFRPYETFLPQLATGAERDLYLSELEAILAVLREEYGVS